MKKQHFLIALFAGFIGYLLGIAYAPDKGENTIKKVKRNTDDLQNDLHKKYHDAKHEIKERFNDVKDVLHDQKRSKDLSTEELILKAKKEIADILENISKVSDEARKNVDNY